MPIRANRYYGGGGDPGFAQAESNIAKLFAPPSGSDMYAAQHAVSEREKAARLSEMFNYAKDPSYSRDMAERMGVATGTFNPNQGYYAVDQGNATTRATNAADNATKLQQTTLQQQGENVRSATAPLNTGQTRAPGLGRFFGAPDMPENTQGGVTLGEGQVYVGPNGFNATGLPRPLTETEMKAKIVGEQDAATQRNIVTQGVPVETIQGPDGPRIVNRQDAVGQAPLSPDMSGRVQNYGTPGGARGLAVPDRTGRMSDAQTGAPLPADAQVYNSQAAGTPDQLGGKTTEAEGKYALALKLTEKPTQIINDMFSKGQLPSGSDDFLNALGNAAPGGVGTLIQQQMSPEAQRFHQAIKQAVPYELLALSGAGVTEAEYERTMARMVPYANDPPQVKQDKIDHFNAFRQGIQGLSGGAAAKVGVPPLTPMPTAPGNAGPAPGQPTMPPLGAPVPAGQQGQQAAGATPPAATATADEHWVRGPDGKMRKAP